VVTRTVARGGSVVIPAFAVDRTQLLMYYLRVLEDQKRIPSLPVYVDSPMAINVTDLYVRHRTDHDIRQSGNDDILNVKNVHLTRTVEDSKKINEVTTPCIIISASGMITGGRVLHHLAQRLPDSRSAVLLVGYQAEGSGGRALQNGAKFLMIHGQQIPVRAEVVDIAQLSAHAGKSELLRWLSGFKTAPKQTFMIHGEPSGLTGLRDAIVAQYKWPNVTIPGYLQSFDLT
jgi:metallo-beta-lactamase family protein